MIATLNVRSVSSGVHDFIFYVLDRVSYVVRRAPIRVYLRLWRGQKPLFLSVQFGGSGCFQPHAARPRPIPPCKNAGVRPMAMQTRCCKVFFPNFSRKKLAEEIYSRSAAVVKTEKVVFVILFVHAAARVGTWALTVKIVNTLIKHSSRDDWRCISTWNQPAANPLRVGQGQ